MVGVLIRMKLAVLRHTITGGRATWILTGAASTIAVATIDADRPGVLVDLLAVVFAIWTLGWMLGPVFGGDPVLRRARRAAAPVTRPVRPRAARVRTQPAAPSGWARIYLSEVKTIEQKCSGDDATDPARRPRHHNAARTGAHPS